MSSDTNKRHLIRQIESLSELDGRYTSCKCINFALGQPRRGHFSLVFKARDQVEQKDVALKFFDPDYLGQTYRLACFKREPEILDRLKSSKRCVQINGAMRQYGLEVPLPNGDLFSVPCNYFVCDWIDDDVDAYFDRQDEIEALSKLSVFRGLVAAVNAVHTKNICHRDVHVKNFRSESDDGSQLVSIIDFGTAAAHDSAALLPEYASPVGILTYAAPETFVGMAGERRIGKLADIYALGCLLYELFNPHTYLFARDTKTEFRRAVSALGLILSTQSTASGKAEAWKRHVGIFRAMGKAPTINNNGSTVPPAIAHSISDIYKRMTDFDYSRRVDDLTLVLRRIDSLERILVHEDTYQARLAMMRSRRKRRAEKARRKQDRLKAYQTGLVEC